METKKLLGQMLTVTCLLSCVVAHGSDGGRLVRSFAAAFTGASGAFAVNSLFNKKDPVGPVAKKVDGLEERIGRVELLLVNSKGVIETLNKYTKETAQLRENFLGIDRKYRLVSEGLQKELRSNKEDLDNLARPLITIGDFGGVFKKKKKMEEDDSEISTSDHAAMTLQHNNLIARLQGEIACMKKFGDRIKNNELDIAELAKKFQVIEREWLIKNLADKEIKEEIEEKL